MWYADTLGEVRKRYLLVLAMGFLIPELGWARVIYVDDDAPVGGDGRSWETAYRFLQDGLAVDRSEDEIRVAQGIYYPDRSSANPMGTRNREVSFELHEGTILKGGYAGLGAVDPNIRDCDRYETVLSGDLAVNDSIASDMRNWADDPTRSDNAIHVVLIDPDPRAYRPYIDLEYLIDGFLITGGQADAPQDYPRDEKSAGGGLLQKGITYLTIRSCRFERNYATFGGGLCANDYTSLKIFSSKFCKNAGKYCGGAVFDSDVEAELVDCLIQGNWAKNVGGGLGCGPSTLRLMSCRFISNSCAGSGGGIALTSTFMQIYGCLFESNMSHFGGGISCSGGDALFINNSRFKENNCKGDWGGGAIGIHQSEVDLSNCIFTGNTAHIHGGVITSWRSPVIFKNCTAQGNKSAFGRFLSIIQPGFDMPDLPKTMSVNSLMLSKSQPPLVIPVFTITNSILDNGGEELFLGIEDYEGPMIEVQYSNLVDYKIPVDDLHQEMVISGPGNLHVDPCFVEFGYWDDLGTPDDLQDDIFVDGDYHLKSQAGRWESTSETWVRDDVTSPCIDAGDLYAPIEYEPFPNGGVINMGAYGGTVEASKSYFGEPPCETIMAGDINGDCRVDRLDLEILVRNWSETCLE